MRVILINGSPHENGCTFTALKEVEKVLNKNNIETEIMWIGNKPIGGCIGCNKCLEDNKCFMNDSVNEFLEKMKEVDGCICGSPVHFGAISGNLKCFLDRAFYGRGKLFDGKVYASVVSCRRGGATAAFDELNKYALMSNMYIVGSSYWNQIHGTNSEEASKDLEGLQTMRNLGENFSYILKCFDLANKMGINPSKREAKIKTNFI
ncbi:MAG: flavodoxin family protein [Clostridiales bacterium]|nr:flavodoxin family protein [Clostridiales bacterium]